MSYAELRFTEKRTAWNTDTTAADKSGDNAGSNNEIAVGHTISANEPIGSGTDESGEFGAETNIGELLEKLQQIRGLNKQFNPAEQRRVAEADKRAEQQARNEIERLNKEQRNIEREYFSHNDEHER
jgi:hypothetical protein